MTQNNLPSLAAWGVRLAGGTAALIGGFWLMAWMMGWSAQWSAAGVLTVKTNMAVGQILAGVALLLLAAPAATSSQRALGSGLAAAVLILGTLTLGEHLFSFNLGIDQLLATEPPGAAATASPNRMGPPGSLSLALLGVGLLTLAWRRYAIVSYAGLAVCLITLVPAVGYLYSIEEFFRQPRLTAIAWSTVAALSSLGLGLVLTQRETGPMRLLLQEGPGGDLLRRRLPVVLLVPLALGFLFLRGEQLGWYGDAYGNGLLVISLVVIFSLFMWRSALHLNHLALAEAAAHRTVRASEARLKYAQQIANVGSWEWDIGTGALFWSEQIYRQMGEQPGQFTPNPDAFRQRVHPEDRGVYETGVQSALAGTAPYDLEFRIVRPDGTERVLHSRGEVARSSDGKPHRLVGVCVDITEPKRVEVALRESEERTRGQAARLQATLDAAPALIWAAQDRQCRTITGNRAACQISRVREGENLSKTGPTPTELAHYRVFKDGLELAPQDMPIQRAAASGQSFYDYAMEFRFEDGTVRSLLGNVVPVLDAQGQPDGAIAAFLDITELRQADQALRTAHARTAALLEQMSDGFATFDRNWRYIQVNPAAARAFHMAPEQLLGKNLWELWPAAYDLPVGVHFRRSVEENLPLTFETFYPNPLNRWFQCRCYPLPEGLATFFIDITERKQAEEQLRELSQRLTYHVDHSPLAVIEWGPDMRLIRWSGAAERLFGWQSEEVLGKRMEDFRWIYPEDQTQVAEISTDLQTGANPRRFSANRNYRKDGSVVHCEWYNSSLVDASGALRSILSLVLDVTERKQAEERLKVSLQEKEVMLKEIHHRVKNNLQVISSLVDLQAAALDNPSFRQVFAEVRNRVRSMALVHEKLYQSESLARVDFADYTRSLLKYLWRAHESSLANIRLKLELHSVWLSAEQAVPCGLILNELVTNVLKHAFRGRSEGDVTVGFHADPGGRVCLRVSDNGVGLPAGLNWRQSPSLGLRLIQMLATQLKGTAEMHTGTGTEFLISFKPLKPPMPEEVPHE